MEEPQSWPATGDDRSEKTAEKLRALRSQADQSLEGHRSRVSDVESELTQRLLRISQELARDQAADELETAATADLQSQLQELQSALADRGTQLESLHALLEAQTSEHRNELGRRDEVLESLHAQLEAQTSEQQQQLDQRDEEFRQLREQFDQAQTERDTLAEQHQEQQEQAAQLAVDLESARQRLDELGSQECTDCANLRDEVVTHQQLCEEHRAKCSQLSEELIAARQEVSEHEEQLQQVNRKFELALADVHKLKRENTELHGELASRPVASDVESPELLSLRSERDALAARVTELENTAPQAVDVDMQQEAADLQRRFELAVDDVRQLKQENAQLRGQLESTSDTSDAADADGSDWQAQRARLMAELDAEDQGSVTPERRRDIATIEGTISITDEVVAAKDKELAELRAALEATPAEANAETLEDLKRAVREEIFADDELIQAERKRLEETQIEWQEKLRQAELEFSVERAKLAREQSELAGKVASLHEANQQESPEEQGKPRRRWLSALGLSEDED